VKITTYLPRRFWRLFTLGLVALTVALWADFPAAKSASGSQGGSGQSRTEGQRSEGSSPRLPWWNDPAVVKELKITTEQAARIEAVWQQREQNMRGATVEYRKHREALNKMLAERKVGIDVIGVQVDRVEAQRTTLEKSRVLMLYEFSLVLTPKQNELLQAYRERNRRGRGDSRRQ
jgi:Spy/CpxP family protein refolding chaperone